MTGGENSDLARHPMDAPMGRSTPWRQRSRAHHKRHYGVVKLRRSVPVWVNLPKVSKAPGLTPYNPLAYQDQLPFAHHGAHPHRHHCTCAQVGRHGPITTQRVLLTSRGTAIPGAETTRFRESGDKPQRIGVHAE